MKKEIKVVAIILVALIVFLSGYGLGASKGIKIEIGGTVEVNGGAAVNAGAVQQPQATQPQATQPQATQPSTPATPDAPEADAPEADAPAGDSGSSAVPSTKEEIAAAYNKAVNDFKAYTGNATEKKTETIAIQVKDLPGPVAAIVNPVVEGFTGTTENTYTFTNGVDADGNKTADRIIPGGRDANIQAAGIAEASATANADGGYTMKIKFVAESSNFDGTQNTSEPEFHKGAMDPLNLGGLDLGPIKISEAGLDYPGATVEATVDGQGRLVKLVQILPLGGFGTGKAGPIKATINLEGSMDATYEITYA
ncbi:MAG: hypothetical protein J6V06_01610 [Clostridia bacterium]|nr:hypothetical protein [Clostridia bacterium]